ncbi:phage tail protein [Dickeya zeae]|nr:phage tail protein [Dickeya zeae]
MGTKYFTLLTQVGEKKLAAAIAAGKALELAQMGVGDGNGVLPTPDPLQTKLVNEKRRGVINSLTVDPDNTNQMIAEQVIPENEGGFWLREIGLYDVDGDLIALGNCPETYKPELKEGSGRVQTVRMILIVSRTDAITLKFDPTVALATRRYADTLLADHVAAVNPHKQYAPIESPVFTGTPAAPTAPISNKTMQIATTEFVHATNTGIVGDMRNARMMVPVASTSATFTSDVLIVADALAGTHYRLANVSETVSLSAKGAGGMDTGSVPTSGFVAVYIIYNPETGERSVIATNATPAIAPEIYSGTLPQGYTASALVSVWMTDGYGRFIAGNQVGREISTPQIATLSAVTPVTTTTAFTTTSFPKNARKCRFYSSFVLAQNTTVNANIYSDLSGLGRSTVGMTNTGGGGAGIAGSSELLLSSPQTLYYDVRRDGDGGFSWALNLSGYEF